MSETKEKKEEKSESDKCVECDQCVKPMVMTSNNLADVIGWLKEEQPTLVVLHARGYAPRFFHNQCDEKAENLPRVIYVDVSRHVGLLDQGEWDWYIIEALGKPECTCDDLKNKAHSTRNITHYHQFSLGYGL